jgi:hypothetical protein
MENTSLSTLLSEPKAVTLRVNGRYNFYRNGDYCTVEVTAIQKFPTATQITFRKIDEYATKKRWFSTKYIYERLSLESFMQYIVDYASVNSLVVPVPPKSS